ncbi:MAG: hypothetical protein NZM31_03800 [Gemmatales bacterium]|nr:hypothetical protein [Gemmatales bacterium]MDW8386124.1 hypothetical protein [Gemmatales bacterium]
MNCHDFARKLETYLDGGSELRPALADHAGQCPSCREQLAWADRLLALPFAEPVTIHPEWTEQVVQAVLRDRRLRRRRRWAMTLAAAACLLLALLAQPLLRGTGQPQTEPGPLVAENQPSAPKPEPPPPPLPDLTLGSALRFGPTSLEATRNFASEAARQASSLTAAAPPIRPAPRRVDPVPDPMADLGRNASEGLEPVVRSTRRAFDAWLDLLPMPTEEKPGL